MNKFIVLFSLFTFSSYGANIALPNLPSAIPSTNDTIAGVKGGVASQFLLKNIIALNTNNVITLAPTAGLVSPIQTALNNIPSGGPAWGTNVTGALINLKSGDYYVSNTLFYSNTFPYFIRIRGDSLSTRIIWAGSARTNLMKFCGGGNPNGGLNLPAQVEIEHITFSSVTNDLISFLTITNESYSRVSHCNFTGWELLTNNLHGSAVSIDGPAPTQPQGNVGLVIGSPLSHSTVVEDCFFAGLATGLHNFGDHFYGNIIKSAYIGIYSNSQTDGTAWPNTSPYSLGFVMVFGGGLDINIDNTHLYGVNGGIMNDGGPPIYLNRPLWEAADHAIATFDLTKTFYITEAAISDDSIKYKVNHSPYSLTASSGLDVRYSIWSKMIDNASLNGNGNRATNFSLLSGDHVTGAVIDGMNTSPDTNHIYVVGSSLTSANGIYTWKGSTASLVFWTNTTACGIILDRTGGSVSINTFDAFEITNNLGHLYGIDTSEITLGATLLSSMPDHVWELVDGSGTPPTSAKWGTNYSAASSVFPYNISGSLFTNTPLNKVPQHLPLNTCWIWNSNGDLYGIKTTASGTTEIRSTNKLW